MWYQRSTSNFILIFFSLYFNTFYECDTNVALDFYCPIYLPKKISISFSNVFSLFFTSLPLSPLYLLSFFFSKYELYSYLFLLKWIHRRCLLIIPSLLYPSHIPLYFRFSYYYVVFLHICYPPFHIYWF